MNIHIALYKWKALATPAQVDQALAEVEALANKIPGIIEIKTGENTSKFSEGYTHVILVQGENQVAIDAYRRHPGHLKAAAMIEALEDHGIGVDFEPKSM